MAMNLRPLGSRLIVEPIQEQEMTALGIVLPETAKERPQKGKVLSVGPGRRLDSGERQPMDVAVGDTVLYAKYGGTEIKVGDQDLLVLNESDVLCILLG